MARRPDRALGVLARDFVGQEPGAAARLLEAAPAPEVAGLLGTLPPAAAVRVLERLTPEAGAAVVAALADDPGRRILPALDPARLAALLARLAPEARERHLALVPAGAARELRTLMAYPPDTAGALMDPRATTFRPDATAGDMLARLRALRAGRVDDLFLVDDEGRLAGVVAIQDVALASRTARLDTLARPPVSVPALAARDDVVDLLARTRVRSLPVVDVEGRLLGVIRHGGLVQALQEETTLDLQTMVGASREERVLSPVWFAVKKRLPWLEVNLGTAFLAAAVVGLFEDTIARFTALAVLLPVVAGQSGNTGAQALAVTMRGLALREIRVGHWPRVTFKEVNVAFLNGAAVALTTSLGVLVWSRSLGLALVIGLSMVISMIAAGLAGATIPIVLSAVGQDPAQSSSIILTTVTDVVGFLSFLGIATLMAGLL